jgi:hypothetical protein
VQLEWLAGTGDTAGEAPNRWTAIKAKCLERRAIIAVMSQRIRTTSCAYPALAKT